MNSTSFPCIFTFFCLEFFFYRSCERNPVSPGPPWLVSITSMIWYGWSPPSPSSTASTFLGSVWIKPSVWPQNKSMLWFIKGMRMHINKISHIPYATAFTPLHIKPGVTSTSGQCTWLSFLIRPFKMLLWSVSFKWVHKSPPCHLLGARLVFDSVLPDTKSFMECITIVKLKEIFHFKF